MVPGEAALFPNISKATLGGVGVGAGGKVGQFEVLNDTPLEAEEIVAGGIGFGRGGLVQEPAQVVEVFLVGGGFLALVAGPFLFEFSDRHALWFRRHIGKPRERQDGEWKPA